MKVASTRSGRKALNSTVAKKKRSSLQALATRKYASEPRKRRTSSSLMVRPCVPRMSQANVVAAVEAEAVAVVEVAVIVVIVVIAVIVETVVTVVTVEIVETVVIVAIVTKVADIVVVNEEDVVAVVAVAMLLMSLTPAHFQAWVRKAI
jgi:hypothetical protein